MIHFPKKYISLKKYGAGKISGHCCQPCDQFELNIKLTSTLLDESSIAFKHLIKNMMTYSRKLIKFTKLYGHAYIYFQLLADFLFSLGVKLCSFIVVGVVVQQVFKEVLVKSVHSLLNCIKQRLLFFSTSP